MRPRLLLWFGIALALRLAAVWLGDNGDGDGAGRLVGGRAVVETGTLDPSPFWLPAHFWFLAIPFALGGSDSLGPRLLTALLGTAAVPLTWAVARRLFGAAGAEVAAAVLALSPLHLRLSNMTVSEGPFLTLLATAALGVARWVQGGQPLALAGATLAYALACGHRVEAWLVWPVIALASVGPAWAGCRVDERLSQRRLLVAAVVTALGPLSWAAYDWLVHDDALRAVTANAIFAHGQADRPKGVAFALGYWPMVLVYALGPAAVVAGLVGLARAVRGGSSRLPAIALAGLATVYVVQTARGTILLWSRYAALLGWLLALHAGFGVRAAPRARAGVLLGSALWLVAVVVTAPWFASRLHPEMGQLAPVVRFSAADHAVATWLLARGERLPIALLYEGLDVSPVIALLTERIDGDRLVPCLGVEPALAAMARSSTGWLLLDAHGPAAAEVRRRAGDRLERMLATERYEVWRWNAPTGVAQATLTPSPSPPR